MKTNLSYYINTSPRHFIKHLARILQSTTTTVHSNHSITNIHIGLKPQCINNPVHETPTAEGGELAAGLENVRERVPVGPPPESAHPTEEAERAVERAEAEVCLDEGVPVKNGEGRGGEALERGEGVRGGTGAVQVGGDEAG